MPSSNTDNNSNNNKGKPHPRNKPRTHAQAAATPPPPLAAGVAAPPPPRVAIENLDFFLADQKKKELQIQHATERHKHKIRQQRHQRKASFGATPSITEEGVNLGDDEWLKAVVTNPGGGGASGSGSGTGTGMGGGASAGNPNPNTSTTTQQQSSHQPQPQPGQQGFMSYMVPLEGNTCRNTQQQHDSQAQQGPYAPWPVGSGYNYYTEQAKQHRRKLSSDSQDSASNHLLKNPHQHQQQHHRQAYPEMDDDDEYAALLQQNLAGVGGGVGVGGGGGGYGATSSSSPYAPHKQHPVGPPPSGRGYPPRKGGSPSSRYSHHKQSSYPAPRRNSASEVDAAGYYNPGGQPIPPPPPPPPTYGHQSPVSHIHRRSQSDTYNQYTMQQMQMQQQHNQHPLLQDKSSSSYNPNNNSNNNSNNNNNSSNKPPRFAGSSPRTPVKKATISNKADANFQSFPSHNPSLGSPGHRRARSGSGRLLGLRHPTTGESLSPSTSFSNLFVASSGSLGGPPPRSSSAPGGSGGGGGHRRSSSLASTGNLSLQSEASFMSVVTDIRKSSFYSGLDHGTGQVQMNYPRANVHLSHSHSLQQGWIYAIPVDTEAFEEYHRQAEEAMLLEDEELGDGFGDGFFIDDTQHRCSCPCPACYNGCTGHPLNHHRLNNNSKPKDPFSKLPPVTFCLGVDEDVYKRVLDEISQSSTMPCGLFYCGHHEDIAHPSVMLALVPIVVLFCLMGYVAYTMNG